LLVGNRPVVRPHHPLDLGSLVGAALTKTDQTFGYWHETYRVEPGSYEAIYGSMPRFGLAAAGDHLPIEGATNDARSRLTEPPA